MDQSGSMTRPYEVAGENNVNGTQSAITNDDGDDYEEENAIDLIKDFSSHKHMERVHKALLNQLQTTAFRLKGELVEKREDLKRLAQEREVQGVQLYGLQQQLSRVQISLETAHTEYNNLVDNRLQEEDLCNNISKNNDEKQALLDEYKRQQSKYEAELAALNETKQQIEKYNEEVKSEIAITRRAAYKTEQSLVELEKHKETQDDYADRLSKQIKQLQQQINLYSSQLESQKGETDEANNVLGETVAELDLIANEKKHIMVQWKSALTGLSRRDEALAQASLTLAAAESAVHDYDVEVDSTKRDILKEQARHESLVNTRDRLESELQWVEDNLTKLRQERDHMQERYTLLAKSLTQTDAESKKLDILAKQLNSDAESLLQTLQVVFNERQKIEEEVQTMRAMKGNVSKAVDNLLKEQSKLLKVIHEREVEANEIENEIARTKVDRLNITSVIDQVNETVDAATKEVQEKEALINKYQLEIRQRSDEIEKKMYRVDRLNKKYEKMVESAGGEENLGPMENTIKNLKKETELIGEECKELERDWLRKQTDLVGMVSESDKLNEDNVETQARITILSQQQVRLTKDLRQMKSDVKVATQTNTELQKDVAKLNGLINQNHAQEGELQHANFVLERGCVDELKDMEKDCVQLEASINEMKNNKAQLLDEIMDTERQVLLWEKKIQLDKETREALDPSVGQAETQNMEREIHRMSLRVEALKREQERMIGEMERAIYKRGAIANRYHGKAEAAAAMASSSKSTASQELTIASVKKKIGNLKKEVRTMGEETIRYVANIEEKKAQLHEMTSELERVTTEFSLQEDQSHRLQTQINDLLYQKQLNQERIFYKQKYSRRLREVAQLGVDMSQKLQVERRLLSSVQALDNVKIIIDDLNLAYPHLRDVLERVATMTDPDINMAALPPQ